MTDISASPGRQAPANQLRPKEPPPMVIQGDFRKVPISITLILFKYLLKAYLFFSPDYFYICQRTCYSISFLDKTRFQNLTGKARLSYYFLD